MNNAIINVNGIQVGHYTDVKSATGCTVILCPDGTTAGVDVRGGAPGTRDLALLDPVCTVDTIHAVVLSGGSAFGLASADGVMQWLEEKNIGFHTQAARVPIVPTAILYDLAIGSSTIRPKAIDGYAACKAATYKGVDEGNVGAGAGATIGKLNGPSLATKGGLGTASITLDSGVTVGALVAVNAIGDVIDPGTQSIIAGTRMQDRNQFANSLELFKHRAAQPQRPETVENTTIGVIATNATLTKAEATKVAQMAHNGLARTIRPVHTALDGDTIFALATGELALGTPSQLGTLAADVLAEAVLRGVAAAESLHGIPSAKELGSVR